MLGISLMIESKEFVVTTDTFQNETLHEWYPQGSALTQSYLS